MNVQDVITIVLGFLMTAVVGRVVAAYVVRVLDHIFAGARNRYTVWRANFKARWSEIVEDLAQEDERMISLGIVAIQLGVCSLVFLLMAILSVVSRPYAADSLFPNAERWMVTEGPQVLTGLSGFTLGVSSAFAMVLRQALKRRFHLRTGLAAGPAHSSKEAAN